MSQNQNSGVRERLAAIAQKLGLVDKINNRELTAEEKKQLEEVYLTTYQITISEDKAKEEEKEEEKPETNCEGEPKDEPADEEKTDEEPADEQKEDGEDEPKEEPADEEKTDDEKTAANQMAEIFALTGANNVADVKAAFEQKEQQLKQLKNMAENQPIAKVKSNVIDLFGAHTQTHLFGIDAEMYATTKWYNKLMLDRNVKTDFRNADLKAFRDDFDDMANAIVARSKELHTNGQMGALNFEKLCDGTSGIDYSVINNQLGEYITRRSDLVLAYIHSLPTVTNIFPLVSNIQNKEAMPAVQFAELSQGYKKGNIFKGSVSFEADIYRVNDVMFKFDFEDMVELEKAYVGYLNREGSAVIKWSFIEWILVHFGEILANEQNRRRVMGVYVPNQNVTANPAMFAADGVLRAIERAEEEHRVLPFENIGTYDSSTILSAAQAMWDAVTEIVPNIDDLYLYMNAKHRQWYIRQYRSTYGTDTDFSGSNGGLVDIPGDRIIWVPNMPNDCYKMFVTSKGNVEVYEDKPNEMYAFDFDKELESVKAISRWKEGAGIQKSGVKYATADALVASGRENQFIFTNLPSTAKTLASTLDLSGNNLFVISGNTAVTTVSGTVLGRVYKLVASAAAVQVAKSGAFSKIESAFTAGAAGDYIKVYAELETNQSTGVTAPTGKFLELERVVTA